MLDLLPGMAAMRLCGPVAAKAAHAAVQQGFGRDSGLFGWLMPRRWPPTDQWVPASVYELPECSSGAGLPLDPVAGPAIHLVSASMCRGSNGQKPQA